VTSAPTREPTLLERDGEIALIENLIAATAAGEGGLLVVEAEAGVGKTELLRAAGTLGEAAGLRVLRARGSELDRPFAFGLVRQLLEREAAAFPELLTGGAEPAAAVLGVPGAAAPSDGDPFSSLQGLVWFVADLSARSPLLLLADDLHWADTPSLRWLAFLAERLEDVAVLVVGATRPAEPGAEQGLLDALALAAGGHMARPAPLSPHATTAVVQARMPAAVEAFGAACHQATGGNPFLLSELAGELARHGRTGSAAEAAEVLDFGPERVGRALRRRIRGLPPEATSVTRALAVLGPGASLEDTAALGDLGLDATAAATYALVGIDVLSVGDALDFVHPVVRAAVYDQIPPLEVQRLHLLAAESLMASGAESERVARHLLRLPPAADEERLETLRAAAREAFARGAASAAADYLRRAVEEPAPAGRRSELLHELGVAEASDRRAEFVDHLRAAMAAAPTVERRAGVALDLGRALGSVGDFDASIGVLDPTLAELEDPEAEVAVALEAELLTVAAINCAVDEPIRARFERRFAQLAEGRPLHAGTLAALAVAEVAWRGPAAAGIALADRALAPGAPHERNSIVPHGAVMALQCAGELGRSGRLLDERIDRWTRHGSRMTVAGQYVLRSAVSLRLGEVRRAETEARFPFDRFEEGIGPPARAWVVALLMDALVARGALDEAEEILATSVDAAGLAPSLPVGIFHDSIAALRLAQGRAAEALGEAESAGAALGSTWENPNACAWRSHAALALSALDRHEEARAMAEAELEAARRFGVADAEGVALRTLGYVTGGAEGTACLRASVEVLGRTESRFERARSLLELGAALRRAGERIESRDVLREALDANASTGATALADRAHEELVAAGARPRRDRRLLSGPESLTAGEDRVAVLAAQGLTNREIAQRLFVTVKAVQFHLRNVYRKLDIASREELPQALELEPAP
jgi:DNA-binding CsgD family transcriptional regulator